MSPIALLLFSGLACKKPVKVTEEPKAPVAAVEKPVAEPQPLIPDPPAQEPESIQNLRKNFQRVHFELDSHKLTEDSQQALAENIEILLEYPSVRVEIQGHADERGTTDYNISLGQKRGQNVYRYMTTQGVGENRLKVVSYGEEKPLDKASGESAWSQNRRCEFVIIWSDSPEVKGSNQD